MGLKTEKKIVQNLLHKDLSYEIHGAAIEVRKDFGPGHKEKLYQDAFAMELKRKNIGFKKEPAIKIYSPKDGKYVGLYRPDFVVDEKIIIEMKAKEFVNQNEWKRVYDYLRNSKYELAYFINFASTRLFVKRIIFTNDRKPFLKEFLLVFISLLLVLFSVLPVQGAAGINPQFNYQGRLTNSSGANVSDGAYNFVFKLYTASSGGSAIWTETWSAATRFSSTVTGTPPISGGTSVTYVNDATESYLAIGDALYNTTANDEVIIESFDTGANTITISPTSKAWSSSDAITTRIYVRSGLFSSRLGSIASLSSINLNQTPLYLGVAVGADSEMTPRKRITSVLQAFQANKLDGYLTSTSTSAASEYGSTLTVSDTGIVTTGTDATYGLNISATRTGATGGTINTYGLYSAVTGDTGGTSTAVGGYFSATGADDNYGLIVANGTVGIGPGPLSTTFALQVNDVSESVAFAIEKTNGVVVLAGADATLMAKLKVGNVVGYTSAIFSSNENGVGIIGGAGGTPGITFNAYQPSSGDFLSLGSGFGGSIYLNTGIGSLSFILTNSVGSYGATFTQNTPLTILNDGKIGIGTTSPLLKLDVAGSGRFTGASTSVLTGSIDPAASTTVTGVGTLFTTELVVGDRITVTGETRTVTAIASNTSLTVDTAFSDNANDTSPDKLAAIFVARDSSNAVKMVVNDLGNVGIGTTSPNNRLEVLSTTTPQMRVAYDASNYATIAVASNGATTVDAAGAGAAFSFSDAASFPAGATITCTGCITDANVVDTITASNYLPLAGGTLTGNLLFSADNTYDIGASGATRPRTGYFGTSVVVGSTTTITTNAVNFSSAATMSLANSTNALNIDSDTLVVDALNNRVGIGTNAPNTALDLNGALTQRGMAAPAVSPSGQGRLYFDSTANKMKISENGGAYVNLLGETITSNTAARVYRSGAQSISVATYTKIQFNAENYDTGNNFDSTTNYRYIVPVSGRYLISSALESIMTVGNEERLYIYINGVSQARAFTLTGATSNNSIIITNILNLAANDYIEIYYYQNVGTKDIIGTSESTYLSIHRLTDAADGDWVLSGNNMYSNVSGNVGIGASSPTHKLQITDTDTTAGRAGLYVAQSGAVSGTGYGGYFTKTGASTTNIGLYASATGATNNYAAIFENGSVGIGTTGPGRKLDVLEAASNPQLRISQSGSVYSELYIDASGDLRISATGGDIRILDENLRICAGGACPSDPSGLSGNGNILAEGTIFAAGFSPATCPAGMISVPASPADGTQGFCVDKYETQSSGGNAVSVEGGSPWVSITQYDARAQCIRAGKHLITESEWQTIAHSIENVGWNWNGGVAGTNQMSDGHSDNSPSSGLATAADTSPCSGTGQTCDTSTWDSQRRIYKLGNGEYIWDFGGNVWEWTDAINHDDYPIYNSAAAGWVACSTSGDGICGNTRTTNDQWYRGGTTAARGFIRGGHWADGALFGAFALLLADAPGSLGASLGFRCAQ